MATYTVNAGDRAVGKITLTASQVDTVTFTDNVQAILVHNRSESPADVWATVDGSSPTVPAAGVSTPGVCIPAGASFTFDARNQTDAVKLISSGAAVVNVQVAEA